MEENKKFRNHISIIFEQAGSGIFILLFFFIWQVIGDPEFMEEIVNAEADGFVIAIVVAIAVGIILLIFGIQFFIWSKTYISIQGNTIVVEKNTLKKEKKTIGIKNISNVNTEQNVFEMLVGTCKIKMDTDSLSTADSTDVKIVLKKEDAEELKRQILALMNQQEVQETEEVFERDEEGAGLEKMLSHGFYSIQLFSLLFGLGSLLALAAMVGDIVNGGMNGEGVFGMISSILVLAFLAVSSIWGIVKEFLQYYGFSVKRAGDRIHIRYGLLKKVNYTIPVDKINAVRFIQSPQGRLAKKCMVELINVGMGDDEEEEKSFFLMYDKEEYIAEQIKQLIPEFSGCLEKELKKQPSCVWKVWIFSEVIFLAILAGIYVVVSTFFAEYLLFARIGIAGILLFVCVWLILKYRTEGNLIDDDLLGICRGGFRKERIFVKYDKIQYVEMHQNMIAKYLRVARADIYLLAATVDKVHEIPYFKVEEIEKIKENLLG